MAINVELARAKLFLRSALLLITVFATLAPAQQHAKGQSALIKRFDKTIYNAAVYKDSNLRPLNPLKFDPTSQTVRVVTITGYQYAKGSQTLSRDVWVTAVPEVKEKCQGVRGDLAMWLRELLGLHPDSDVTHFVVMEVKKDDIFRPAPNPDPTTVSPCADPQAQNCGEFFPAGVSDKHKIWIANQMLKTYLVSKPLKSDGYPWTRLGYTYNWRPGADRYGASEYVIKEGSVVTVEELIGYKEYCGARK